tara:strand:+ start:687 stop:965 length:279 start_codon:yes stop_codon:yes gene_type:complete
MKSPAFVYAKICPFTKVMEYRTYPSKSDIWGGILVCETEIEFPEPDYGEVLNGTVSEMRNAQKDIRAKAQVQVEAIEQTIGELLCIEDRSAA